MEQKLMELIPQDVWQLIAQRLSQKERSSARAVSRFFFKRFTPEWDRYCLNRRKIRAIVVGANHSLLLTETGELFGCGSNRSGQLGLEPTEQQASWIKLSDKTGIRAIVGGSSHSLLLTVEGELFGCGLNIEGQLGLGPIKLQASWVLLSDKTHILAISAGTSHSLLLTESGELLGCGNNQNGQLGLGPIENQASWIQLSDKTNIRAVAAGDFHSLLLTETGELFGCGDNRFGQLGLGNTQNQATWVKLNPFPKSHSLCHQRHLAFQSESLKVLLKRCDMLSQQHRAEDDTTQQQALFSEMKSSLQAQLTKPLPALWDQELNDLNVNEFNPFYHRLREHFNLAPAEESSSSNLLTM